MTMLRTLMITTTTLVCTMLGGSAALAAEPADEALPDADRVEGDDDDDDDEGGQFVVFGRHCKSEDEGLETTPDSPPLDTEDPGTAGCNGWEIDLMTAGEFGDGETSGGPMVEVNYGIGDNIDLTLELPYEMNRVDGETTHGLGAAEIGIKHRFYQDESRELGLAFYPQIEIAVPGSELADEEEGLTISLPLLFSSRLATLGKGSFSIGVNAAYNLSTEPMTENFVSASLGIGLPLTSTIAFMIEGSTEQALGKNADDMRAGYLKASMGVAGSFTPSLGWFASVGQSFAGASPEDASRTSASLGVRVFAGGP